MTRAEICIPRILTHEGGYVDHPRDPGGATNRGITLATFLRYIMPGGTRDDLRALSEAQAVVVYRRRYWDAVLADMLPVGVDYAVADFAVNSGPARAAKCLQRVVGAVPDGRVGPKTLAAVAARDGRDVVNGLCDARMAFLRRLRSWGAFGRGWTRRVEDVRRDALADMEDRA